MKSFCAILCLWAATAAAGDWSCGGGEFLRTSANPWFVQNTDTVKYCIEKDPTYFGNLPMTVEAQIETALQYWRENFAATITPVYSNPNGSQFSVQVATQNFVRQGACNSETDLAFYFGVLPPDSKIYLPTPSSFIGATVRTSYDEAQLRGKGFIYVSADGGPLSYSGEYATLGAWHIGGGGLLTKLLVHELGHLFGLPHISASIVMDTRFPELLVSTLNKASDPGVYWPALEGARPDGIVSDFCEAGDIPSAFLDFFEIPKQSPNNFCFQMRYDIRTQLGQVFLNAGQGNGRLLPHGSISQVHQTSQYLGGVQLWLPPTQTVYRDSKAYQTLIGAQANSREISAIYISPSGVQKQILFTLGPLNWITGMQIGGVVDGRVVLDLMGRH